MAVLLLASINSAALAGPLSSGGGGFRPVREEDALSLVLTSPELLAQRGVKGGLSWKHILTGVSLVSRLEYAEGVTITMSYTGTGLPDCLVRAHARSVTGTVESLTTECASASSR